MSKQKIVVKKSLRTKTKDFFKKPKEQAKKSWGWLKENAPVVVPLSVGAMQLIGVILNVSAAKDGLALKMLDKRTWVDPRTNISWDLLAIPTTEQKEALNNCVRNDDDAAETLHSLGLI